MSILISFLNLLLYIAIVLFVAAAIVWAFKWFFNTDIDPTVYKFGSAIVGLLCVIAVVIWLAGVLGGGPGLPLFWHYR